MNIDRENPIGKAADTFLTDDESPEVEGHRRIAQNHEEPQGGDESTEVEGHRRIAQNHEEPEGDDESTGVEGDRLAGLQHDSSDADEPDVKAHLRAR